MSEILKKFLTDGQEPEAINKIYSKVNDLLTSGEEIQYIAVQKKPAVNIAPDCVALTNKRAIFCRPKTFGLTMEFEDYAWKDVVDCHMKEELFGAEFKIKSVYGRFSSIDFLPKAQARKLYQIGQEKEEEQRELRRQRELEDKRASAGGVTVTTSVPTATVENTPRQEDPVSALQKLKTLLDSGLITAEEFNGKKTEILSRL